MIGNEGAFQVGDTVWAKVTGHPYWPARITAKPIEVGKNNFKVIFFKELTHAFLPKNKLVDFDIGKQHDKFHYSSDCPIFRAACFQAEKWQAQRKKRPPEVLFRRQNSVRVIQNQHIGGTRSENELSPQQPEKKKKRKDPPYRPSRGVKPDIQKKEQTPQRQSQSEREIEPINVQNLIEDYSLSNLQQKRVKYHSPNRSFIMLQKNYEVRQKQIRISLVNKMKKMLRARGIKDRAITNHLQNQVMDNPDMVRMNQTLQEIVKWLNDSSKSEIEAGYKIWKELR